MVPGFGGSEVDFAGELRAGARATAHHVLQACWQWDSAWRTIPIPNDSAGAP